jgi:hypothetical protein
MLSSGFKFLSSFGRKSTINTEEANILDRTDTEVPLARGRGRPKGAKNRNRSSDESDSDHYDKKPVGRPAFRPFDLPSKLPLKGRDRSASSTSNEVS